MLYEDYATTDPVMIENLSALLSGPSSASSGRSINRNTQNVQFSGGQGALLESTNTSTGTLSDNSSGDEQPLCGGCSNPQCFQCAKNTLQEVPCTVYQYRSLP
jgi:hypothetical protein